jgi:D-3-phosphoglycerate dehydrogenase
VKIAITDYICTNIDIEKGVLCQDWQIDCLNADSESELLNHDLGSYDGFLVWHAPITEKVCELMKPGAVVVRYGVGYDNIDLEALGMRGVTFFNNPSYGVDEVADTACTMIMDSVRRVSSYNADSMSLKKTWQLNTIAGIRRCSELTVGVIGVGRIGMAVMQRLRGFKFNLAGYDPFLSSGIDKVLNFKRYYELSDILNEADIITLHCPLNTETQGIINSGSIAQMKTGAVLINTARGGLVENLDCLHCALKEGVLRAVYLDVLPNEPPEHCDFIDSWMTTSISSKNPTVIINPHTAYYSEQAWEEMRSTAALTVRNFLLHGTRINEITFNV